MRLLSVISLLFLLIGMNGVAQTLPEKDNLFVRVYDTSGSKFEKGKVLSMTDTTLYVFRKGEVSEVNLSDIAMIKTKRSVGHNAAMGAIAGGVILGLAGVASGDADGVWLSWSKESGGAAGLVLGGVVGAGVGAFTGALKNSKTFIINGDPKNWQAFVSAVGGDGE